MTLLEEEEEGREERARRGGRTWRRAACS